MAGPRPRRVRAIQAVALTLLLAPIPLAAHEVSPADPPRVDPAFDFDDAAADPREVLEAFLAALSGAPLFERLEQVNRFFNRMRQGDDREIWGEEDHWAAPSELLVRGAGDCEDLAIAKYFALRRLGVPADALRVTYARDLRQGRSHMTLLYLRSGRPALVLDNEVDRPEPLSSRPELAPVYGVNEERVTVNVPGGSERSFPHAGRWTHHRWQEVVARARTVAAGVPAGAEPGPVPGGMMRLSHAGMELPGPY